jgi:phosphatidylglycerol:prolipoprotein diacylglycerol transferase
MHPYLLRIPLPAGRAFWLPSYGTAILCGFLLCIWLSQRRARRMGLDPTAVFDVAVSGLLGGIVGARLLHVALEWSQYAEQPWEVLFLWQGGLAFFGGFVGGMVVVVVACLRKRLPLLPTGDLAAGLVPLGHAFGRIGCFLNGCCFGALTDSWAGMRFPRIVVDNQIRGSVAYLAHLNAGLVTQADTHSLPVHPTQLYEAAYNLAIFALLTYLLPRRRRPGQVAWAYFVFYGSARYMNEFFRGDHLRRAALGGMTEWQAVALVAAAFGFVMFLRTLLLPPDPGLAPLHAQE